MTLMTDKEFDNFIDDATHTVADLWYKKTKRSLSIEQIDAINDELFAFFGPLRHEYEKT